MADISDVEQAMASQIADVLYPQGPSNPSVVGSTCRIYRGWPNAATLNSDLAAGIVNVTITSDNSSGRTTTRYLSEWQVETPVPSMSASVTDQLIEIDGIATVGSVVGLLINGATYSYRVVAGDTLDLVAANLCTAVQANFLAIAHGPRIVVPGSTLIKARVVIDASASYESRRQEKDLRIVCWCPSPAVRDLVAAAIDISFAQVSFLSLADATTAHINYHNSSTSDQSQNALLYRRDLVYCVEYPTIVSAELPSMLFGAAAINGQITNG